jgi:O-antigen ligase
MGTYYSKLLVMAAVAIFFTAIPEYFLMTSLNPPKGAPPTLWLIGLAVLSLPLVIGQLLRLNNLKSPLIVWCFGYAWVTVTWFFLSSQGDMAWQEVRWRVITIFQLLMFLMLFAQPNATRFARQALVVCVLVGVVLNIYELFHPMSFSQVLGRSAGLYVNPNQAGQALVMGMIFSVSVLTATLRAPFILLTGIGIFTTFSRSAILQWVIIVVSFMLMRKVRLREFVLPVSVSLLLVAVFLLPRWDQFLTILGSSGMINKNVEERLDWFTDPSGVNDDSRWYRAYLRKQAWDRTAEHPFLGSGTGSSREMETGAHNQYLMFMQDHGLLGAAILPLLVLAVTWGARGEVRNLAILFGCTVMIQGFFSHDLLNQSEPLVLFALMAVLSSTSRESEMKKTQAMTKAEIGRPRVFAKV